MNKKESGITLIALVITIIVLLILAGVSIAMLTGDNGILNKATTAKERTISAAESEKVSLAYNDIVANKLNGTSSGDITVVEMEQALERQGIDSSKATVQGVTGENKIKITFIDTGNEYEVNTKITTGTTPTTPESTEPQEGEEGYAGDGYNKPYIPVGFTHTEGTWNTGYTIKNKTTNDEFVWVPCTTTATSETVAFARITDSSTKYNSNSLTDLSDEGTSAGLIGTSVETYGGFYIAKYEASSSDGTQDGTARSLPNATPWTNITRANSIAKAEAMVNTSDNVKSALISGECWDTTLQWMISTGNTGYDTNSTGKGWYSDNQSNNSTHLTGKSVDTSNATTPNKVNNIWDMAGNVWEWTTENCKLSGNGTVTRGGYYNDSGSNLPAAYRGANYGDAYDYLGFRVVLYK